MTTPPRDVIAEAIRKVPTGSEYVTMAVFPGSAKDRQRIAERALSALAAAGYSVVPTAEYERLIESMAAQRGRFPRGYVVKPERDRDLYVVWSDIVEAPVWFGTRAEALERECPESRLRRADENGTSAQRDPMSSYVGPLFYGWDSKGMIAEQRGWLPRAHLAAYVHAYDEERWDDAWDLLEPFDDERPVRRD